MGKIIALVGIMIIPILMISINGIFAQEENVIKLQQKVTDLEK